MLFVVFVGIFTLLIEEFGKMLVMFWCHMLSFSAQKYRFYEHICQYMSPKTIYLYSMVLWVSLIFKFDGY